MAKKKVETKVQTEYKTAVCGMGNAVDTANEWHATGYDVKYCFAVVAADEEGKAVQAIYMMGKKRENAD